MVRLLVEMREAGTIPFEWLADNTRWMRKPTRFTGMKRALKATSDFYRRDLWASMPVYVEVWVEKDALAGVLMEETEGFDVPLMVARATPPSASSTARRRRSRQEQATFIYHFGDLDPPASMPRATSRPSSGGTLPRLKSISNGRR